MLTKICSEILKRVDHFHAIFLQDPVQYFPPRHVGLPGGFFPMRSTCPAFVTLLLFNHRVSSR